MAWAEHSASITHDHPEGIKGAQAVACAIHLAAAGETKDTIRNEVTHRFGYQLDRTVDEVRKTAEFDVTCQVSVPEAIMCFLNSHDYESAIRNAVSLGADADTQAAIAGSIAEAFYSGVPIELAEPALARLTPHLRAIFKRWTTFASAT